MKATETRMSQSEKHKSFADDVMAFTKPKELGSSANITIVSRFTTFAVEIFPIQSYHKLSFYRIDAMDFAIVAKGFVNLRKIIADCYQMYREYEFYVLRRGSSFAPYIINYKKALK